MRTVLIIGCGGFIGAVARHVSTAFIDRHFHGYFPFGTMAVNVTGCFLLGLMGEGCRSCARFAPELRDFLIIGLVGAFTTFSTLGYDSLELIRGGYSYSALGNLAGSAALGLVAMIAGQAMGRALL